jgi:nucleoside-diphosphate-sugar epimerase
MRIFIAGGAGYIGSKLVPALLDRGYDVMVADLLWFGNHLPKEVPVIQKDLFKFSSEDLQGYEQLIFLAGLSNDPMAEFSPAQNFISNAALPSYLAFIAKQAGVRRFIYASSCSIYGYTVNELYDEDSPVTCGYPYGISKLQGERGVLQHHGQDFSVIALRQGTVCGFSPRMRFDLIVNTMYKCAMLDRMITVNNPSIWRPILDIRDAVTAYLRVIQADYSINGVFNVASGNFTVGQVADLTKEEVEKISGAAIQIKLKNIKDFRNYKVRCDKAETLLGYKPKHDIAGIIEDLFAHRDLYGDCNSYQYYNIEVLKRLAADLFAK